jgi:DNA-directed RNA polymerase specialized sigma24 family protein
MGELCADDFRRLRLYLASAERGGQGSFHAWVVTVTTRSAISYHRAHKRDHFRSHPTSDDIGPGVDSYKAIKEIEAREVLEKARGYLEETQLAALLLWLEGWDPCEIAEQLELEDGSSAARLVHAALWRLRARLRGRNDIREDDLVVKKIAAGRRRRSQP